MRKAAMALALVWFVALAAAPAPPVPPSPSPTATLSPTPTPTPAPTPQPTSRGSINLSDAAGPAGTKVTVTGSGFNPGEGIALYLDTPDHSLGGVVADGSGGFKQEITMPPNTALGSHIICVPQQPQPRCAQFSVQEPAPTPTPTTTPSPSPTASPSPSVNAVALTAGTGRSSALSAFLRSPVGIVLILLLLAALGASIFWFVRSRRNQRRRPLPAAMERLARPVGPPGAYRPGQPPPGAYRPGQPPPPGAYRPGRPPPPGGYRPGQPPPPGSYPPGQPQPPPGQQRRPPPDQDDQQEP